MGSRVTGGTVILVQIKDGYKEETSEGPEK